MGACVRGHVSLWSSVYTSAVKMRERPQLFSHLRMLLIIASQIPKTTEIHISVESLQSGNMAAKIDQQLESKEVALLPSEGEVRFFSNSLPNQRSFQI